MIRADVEFHRQLIFETAIKNKSGILPFGLTPYLSLFVIETYNYFGSRVPSFSSLAKRRHQNILRASRTRTKLFDRKQDITSLMDHLVLRFINNLNKLVTSYIVGSSCMLEESHGYWTTKSTAGASR